MFGCVCFWLLRFVVLVNSVVHVIFSYRFYIGLWLWFLLICLILFLLLFPVVLVSCSDGCAGCAWVCVGVFAC